MHVFVESDKRTTEAVETLRLKPSDLDQFFTPPQNLADDFGKFRSPLKFADGHEARSAADWQTRRQEILASWHAILGAWPKLVEKPKLTYRNQERLEHHTRHAVDVEVMPNGRTTSGYLLVPHGKGPFPAAVVVFYDAETSVGMGKELHGFGFQLANRGYVVLAIGTPSGRFWPDEKTAELQPLSMLAYVAANCHTALAALPNVDPTRIGIVGHSYGGKWAMFASCLYDKFACAAWSDGGIVFDERRANVNYWEPWYLGQESGIKRKEGIPSESNPRTGAYKTLIASGHDLHELHALMAPRPFLVSGGGEDRPEQWRALNHTRAVNRLLGVDDRVAMTNRRDHTPTVESNEQIYAFFDRFLKPRQE
ncbi:MAG: prolyl oligopeptidase family serine peptidase [Planctomycetia bacterium]|nr:prolyl oligopeptidase family serine peptidase [Planctomycetia bacterium]